MRSRGHVMRLCGLFLQHVSSGEEEKEGADADGNAETLCTREERNAQTKPD